MKHVGAWCLLALLYAAAVTAEASPAATPEAQAYIERYGSRFTFDHEQELLALYTRILQQTPHDDRQLVQVRDQHYGPDERNRLDVRFRQLGSVQPSPVLIFFHGGGFSAGDKRLNDSVYDNVGRYFARGGLVAVNATYRLAPKSQWPAGSDDVAGAVQWVKTHASDFGGDPSRIFLMGHSAGATHVAGYLFSDRNSANSGVIGAILMSGVYEVRPSPGADAYYGTDRSLVEERSPGHHVSGSRAVATFLTYAEYDPPLAQTEAVELAAKLCERDSTCPSVRRVEGHNHLSEIFHVDTADDSIAGDILKFVQKTARTAR